MNNLLLALAMVCFVATIAVGSDFIKVKGEWKSVAVTYGILILGIGLFGIVLTI